MAFRFRFWGYINHVLRIIYDPAKRAWTSKNAGWISECGKRD